MRNLTRLIQQARKKQGATDTAILNLIREYLQVLILKAIYQSKYGKGLSFMGGTCLRICYDLKRYSEDLDFALDQKVAGYSFEDLNNIIAGFLKNTDFEVDLKVNSGEVVNKSFIRVSRVLHVFGLSPLKDQKLHVKLEVDTNPVNVTDKERESFFVTKFDEIFPILKHTEETMFAGKIGAVLNRAYTKGRDFYDLIWYLNQKKEINLRYLNASQKQVGLKETFKDKTEIMRAIGKRVQKINPIDILKDIERFLEDQDEIEWIRKYHDVFAGASRRFL